MIQRLVNKKKTIVKFSNCFRLGEQVNLIVNTPRTCNLQNQTLIFSERIVFRRLKGGLRFGPFAVDCKQSILVSNVSKCQEVLPRLPRNSIAWR